MRVWICSMLGGWPWECAADGELAADCVVVGLVQRSKKVPDRKSMSRSWPRIYPDFRGKGSLSPMAGLWQSLIERRSFPTESFTLVTAAWRYYMAKRKEEVRCCGH